MLGGRSPPLSPPGSILVYYTDVKQMKPSLSSLMFKGSIAEAINEAKRQRNLFVVYISGEDDQSVRMESSTWRDTNVAESLLKYCILLQLLEGSTDAAHFSAIYPQKSVPCITAVGYNGVQLWQNEGFVSSEMMASTLEKAWLSLHIQETTATVLSVALASKKLESSPSGTCDTASTGEGSSSTGEGSSAMDIASPSMDIDVQSPKNRPPVPSEIIEEIKGCPRTVEENNTKLDAVATSKSTYTGEGSSAMDIASPSMDIDVQSPKNMPPEIIGCPRTVEENNTKLDAVATSKSSYADELGSSKDEQFAFSANIQRNLASPGKVDVDNSGVGHTSVKAEERCPGPQKDKNAIGYHSGISGAASPIVINENKTEAVEEKKIDALDIARSKSNDVHLNIRLPNGSTLQEKFSVTCSLGMVKDCVNMSQVSGLHSYDLAIPYPRKVFNDQDLGRSLSELGLLSRQALIVVPRQQALGRYREGSLSRNQTNSTPNVDSSNGTNGGYFAYARSILSYLNPFSYLGGSASSSNFGQESQNSMWQYGPNPALQNTIRGTERTPYTRYSPNGPNQTTSHASSNDKKNSRPSTSRIGSNIHTLKHDEEDSQFSDRNSFWNGNSTQYGGDNDGK